MPAPDAKVMFEIYREAGYGRKYRAVYYTELDEHNKETEIARAMAGEHVFDGFLATASLDEGRQTVASIIDRLNEGETVDETQFGELLAPFTI